MRATIDARHYLGAVSYVSRDGAVLDWRGWGHRDLARREPLERDAIFRIYSMTKPIATVAVLMLMEEGKLALADPVSKHLPEFAAHGVNVHQLLTHTSGLATASETLERSRDLGAYSRAAARVAPAAPPGSRFEYNSVNTEVASRLVEALSGTSFENFLETRIFRPLGMTDTGFEVPRRQRHRIVEMTSSNADGHLVSWPAGDGRKPGDRMRRYASGAGGLYSTAGDFARFAHVLLGAPGTPRLLRRETLELMMTNQLTALTPPVSQYREGFGLGGFVNLDDPARARPGSVGAYGWSGAGGTYFMIDRARGVVAMLLTQHLPQGLARDPQKPSFEFYRRVYQALPALEAAR